MTNPEESTFYVLVDGQNMPVNRTVNAAYFVIEDDWVTFKDGHHKVVFAFPSGRVQMIERAN